MFLNLDSLLLPVLKYLAQGNSHCDSLLTSHNMNWTHCPCSKTVLFTVTLLLWVVLTFQTSDLPLVLYRTTVGLVYLLYPETLSNLFISLCSFFNESFCFFYRLKYHLMLEKESLCLPFFSGLLWLFVELFFIPHTYLTHVPKEWIRNILLLGVLLYFF